MIGGNFLLDKNSDDGNPQDIRELNSTNMIYGNSMTHSSSLRG